MIDIAEEKLAKFYTFHLFTINRINEGAFKITNKLKKISSAIRTLVFFPFPIIAGTLNIAIKDAKGNNAETPMAGAKSHHTASPRNPNLARAVFTATSIFKGSTFPQSKATDLMKQMIVAME